MKRSVQEIVELVVFGLIALLVGTGLVWLTGWLLGLAGAAFTWIAALIWSLLRFLVPIALVAGAVYLLVRLMNRSGERVARDGEPYPPARATPPAPTAPPSPRPSASATSSQASTPTTNATADTAAAAAAGTAPDTATTPTQASHAQPPQVWPSSGEPSDAESTDETVRKNATPQEKEPSARTAPPPPSAPSVPASDLSSTARDSGPTEHDTKAATDASRSQPAESGDRDDFGQPTRRVPDVSGPDEKPTSDPEHPDEDDDDRNRSGT